MGKVIEFPSHRVMQKVGMPSPVARGYLFALTVMLPFWAGVYFLITIFGG